MAAVKFQQARPAIAAREATFISTPASTVAQAQAVAVADRNNKDFAEEFAKPKLEEFATAKPVSQAAVRQGPPALGTARSKQHPSIKRKPDDGPMKKRPRYDGEFSEYTVTD